MRFARNAQIFRGSLDPAPLAAVLLLLMMFMMVSSLIYTPGVIVDLGQTITVTKTNGVAFAGKNYLRTELEQLRTDLKRSPADGGFTVVMEPGASAALGAQVSNLFQIRLPQGTNLVGTDDARAIVSVNFRGQFFYENRLVTDSELKSALSDQIKAARQEGRQFMLIVNLDEAAESQMETHLENIARQAGVTKILRAQQPPGFGGQL